MQRTVQLLLAIGTAAAVLLAGDPNPTTTTQGPGFAERETRYELEPGDILDVRFALTPEFNDIVTVQPDGFISLQAAGEINVGGRTIPEATELIVSHSAHVLHEPRVTILLKEFAKPAYYVGGNVSKPGRFELHGQMTVTNAITTAGGFAPGSKDSEVLLIHRISKDYARVEKVNVKDILRKGRVAEDPLLEPNDSIYVTKSKVGLIDRFMQVTRLGIYAPIF